MSGAGELAGPSPQLRFGRAVVLAVGAVAVAVAIGPGRLPFYWTPLLVGAVYLGIVALGGRHDGYWSPALVVSVWGATVVAIAAWELPVRVPARGRPPKDGGNVARAMPGSPAVGVSHGGPEHPG